MSEPLKSYRPIRSFVLREGRLTRGQQRALKILWPRYGLDAERGWLDFTQVFDRRAPVILEIGFGNGETLAQMAAAYPQNNYVGVEVHRPGAGHLLIRLKEQGLDNVRVLCADAKEVLTRQIADASLDAVHLFFPDPWPKLRHHKRRLVQPGFVALVRQKLKLGGLFHLVTDWQDYADHMMQVMSGVSGIENTAGVGGFYERPAYRPITKFERRGRKLGHRVWDLVFQRTK